MTNAKVNHPEAQRLLNLYLRLRADIVDSLYIYETQHEDATRLCTELTQLLSNPALEPQGEFGIAPRGVVIH